jgi:apolipoprotein N-acyltransferase
MNFLQRISLSLLTALLLFAAWPAGGFAPILFLALVPLLITEEFIATTSPKSRFAFFWYSWASMFLFNLLTTWWIWFASPGGMVLAVLANSVIMATVLHFFHVTKKKLGTIAGYAALLFYWTAYEFLHHDWDLSWTWLVFGNGFAAWSNMVQWYEYTGILGGSVWVLLTNIIATYFIAKTIFLKRNVYLKLALIYLIPLILFPLILSGIVEGLHQEKKHPVVVTVVQPNIDPYTEKFGGMSSRDQIKKMLSLAAQKTNDKTDYLIFPETALPDGLWEEDLQGHPQIELLRDFMKPFPGLTVIIGLSSNRFYITREPPNKTARAFKDGGGYYDSYNTAIQLSSDTTILIHHKSKLVVGVEHVPFQGLFGVFEKFAINLGGSSGSLGTQEVPSVFKSDKGTIAPVICYESVYGEYVTKYIEQGAEAIFIITNDGWWHDTPGYRQHCQYAKLRAIETRRPVARSANTGISCFIDQLGTIHQATKYWEPAVISQTIQLNDELTFYTRYGDYIGRIACAISALFAIIAFIKQKKKLPLENH